MATTVPSSVSSEKAPCNRKANRFRSRSLHASATALAATGLAGEAAATIIYDITSSYSSGDGFSFNALALDPSLGQVVANSDMGGDDLWLQATMAMMTDSTVEFSFLTSGMGMTEADYLQTFSGAMTVDGTLNYAPSAYLAFGGGDAGGVWADGNIAYAGFRFDPGGGYVYGWLEIEIVGTDFTISRWAYEDSGGPILPGALSVPEPSTALLFGLGLAGLGARARWLRKRSQSRVLG